MTQSPEPAQHDPVKPTRRDRLRPLELLVFSTMLGVFAGLIVLLTTRDLMLGVIFLGIGFISSVLMVALVGLGGKPSAADIEARMDLQQPENGQGRH